MSFSQTHEFSRYILHHLIGACKNRHYLRIAPGPDDPAFFKGAEIPAQVQGPIGHPVQRLGGPIFGHG